MLVKVRINQKLGVSWGEDGGDVMVVQFLGLFSGQIPAIGRPSSRRNFPIPCGSFIGRDVLDGDRAVGPKLRRANGGDERDQTNGREHHWAGMF